MNKEYAIYPFRYMNITQKHDQGNHILHWKGSTNYSDKPWDEACKDGGRSYFEPKNDFIIEQVLGLNTAATNSVRLRSVNKLYIPYKAEPEYLYVTLTHMNEDNLRQVKQGQILKAGTRILLEGTDGYCTGNHFHITANIGKYYGLLQNSNGKWCYTYDKSLLPNEAFYLDGNWTQVIYAREYAFKPVPVAEPLGTIAPRNENVDQIEVKVPQLYCRTTHNKSGKILGFTKQGIHNYTKKANADGYDWYYIGTGWIAYTSEWCNLYPKKVVEIPKEEPKVEEPTPTEPEKPQKTPPVEENGQDNTNTLDDPKTSENEQENDKKGHGFINFLSSLVKTVVDLLKKIFKVS